MFASLFASHVYYDRGMNADGHCSAGKVKRNRAAASLLNRAQTVASSGRNNPMAVPNPGL